MLIRYPPPPPHTHTHTLRVSEKTWLLFKPADLSFVKKISVESVQTIIINSFMHMFTVSTLYRESIKLLHQKLW